LLKHNSLQHVAHPVGQCQNIDVTDSLRNVFIALHTVTDLSSLKYVNTNYDTNAWDNVYGAVIVTESL